VARVAGSTKAIAVHSSARYPAPKQLEEYHPLYIDVPRVPPKHPKHRLPEAPQVALSLCVCVCGVCGVCGVWCVCRAFIMLSVLSSVCRRVVVLT
jgi:hypothetical protein